MIFVICVVQYRTVDFLSVTVRREFFVLFPRTTNRCFLPRVNRWERAEGERLT